jgi:hypothetical protein
VRGAVEIQSLLDTRLLQQVRYLVQVLYWCKYNHEHLLLR